MLLLEGADSGHLRQRLGLADLDAGLGDRLVDTAEDGLAQRLGQDLV